MILNASCKEKPEKLENIETKIEDSIKVQKKLLWITGTVADDYGYPIADAEVTVIGREIQTITDIDGNFKIEAEIGDELFINDIIMGSETFQILKSDMGILYLNTILVGELIFKRKFPNNVLFKITYPYRKVKQWVSKK